MLAKVGTCSVVLVAAAPLSAFAAQPPAAGASGSEAATISPERAAAIAVNHLEAIDGGYCLRSPALQARFTAEGVELSPRGSDLRWIWRLTGGPGGEAGVRPIAPANPASGPVRYQRAILDEEYELRAGAIAQRFVLPQPPLLDGGDLALEGAVSCDGSFLTAAHGGEWRGERGLVWLGPVTVTEATGALLPSSFQVTAGMTRLTAPSAALADAAYPVTVTTQIRAFSLGISDMRDTGDPGYRGELPAVAYNSTDNQFLVVWPGIDNTGGLAPGEQEIFGKMLGILPFEDGLESGDTSAWSTTVP